jgi:hypothetical protein
MINKTSKEASVELNTTEGNIAFIGNINDCSKYAGRFIKHNDGFSWSNGIATQFDLTRPTDVIGTLYYLGEFFNNILPGIIRDNTSLVVIVDDHIDRRSATLTLLSKIAPNIKVQILQAKTSTGITIEQELLNETDKFVIRELERLFLKGTELNLEREALRVLVDETPQPTNIQPVEYIKDVLTSEELSALSSNEPVVVAKLTTPV